MMQEATNTNRKMVSVVDNILTGEIIEDVSHARYCLNAATNPFYTGGDDSLDSYAALVHEWDEQFVSGIMLGIAMTLDTDLKVRGLGQDTKMHKEMSKVYHSLRQITLERKIGGDLDVGEK